MLLSSFVNKIPAVRETRQIRPFARMSQNCCKKKSEFAVDARDSKENKGRKKKKKRGSCKI